MLILDYPVVTVFNIFDNVHPSISPARFASSLRKLYFREEKFEILPSEYPE